MEASFLSSGVNFGKETSTFLENISKIEALGEEILTDKHQLVDLDRKRNGNREAVNALKKKEKNNSKSWLCIGNTFFKLKDDDITKTLRHDQEELDKEIKSIRNGLMSKVSDLHKLEGLYVNDRFNKQRQAAGRQSQKDVKGFSLASLSSDDMTFIKGDR